MNLLLIDLLSSFRLAVGLLLIWPASRGVLGDDVIREAVMKGGVGLGSRETTGVWLVSSARFESALFFFLLEQSKRRRFYIHHRCRLLVLVPIDRCQLENQHV